MDATKTNILFAVAGLLFLGALVLLGMLYRTYQAQQERRARRAPSQAPVAAGPAATGNLPVDDAFDEEEMPTVIVNQPARPASPMPEAARTPQRSSGATIIAFDDDEEDDE